MTKPRTAAIQRNAGRYLEAGNFFEVGQALFADILSLHDRMTEFGIVQKPYQWKLPDDDQGVTYAQPIGNPVFGEAMRLWAHMRAGLVDELAEAEKARAAQVEGES